MERTLRAVCALPIACMLVLLLASTAAAAPPVPGAKRIKYTAGPFEITPGQNRIAFSTIDAKPKVDGWITRIKPDLTYLNGKIPRVDILHLHHGVWLNLARQDSTSPGLPQRFFAAGEEKTIFSMPRGYGYRYEASDPWLLNHMIHNLITTPTKVYMTYTIDFIPDSSKQAQGMRPVRPVWMDVQNGGSYPVFDVKKGSGRKGRYTYPRDARNPYKGGPAKNRWTVDRDGVLVATAGHLHPGGLHTDLALNRGGKRAHLFRSKAKYYEPAGAVSWDVSMTATRPDWKVKVRKGDVLSTSATYDTKRAAWYESMGIMVVFMADDGPGDNPFKKRVDKPGRVTHGPLRENRNHGGKRVELRDARKLADGVFNPEGGIDITSFTYRYGDLRSRGLRGRPPVVRPGQSLRFVLSPQDDSKEIYHSVTSCKAPCNRDTGIAYPIADGKFDFDSGQLGTRQVPPATGRVSWDTPKSLPQGTYTYFCRIHPFMRGAFRVKR